jgi:hypothetical protein
MLSFRTSNDRIFSELEPFLVATPFHRALMDLQPFGLVIPPENLLDPLLMRSADFLHLLQKLDSLTFGPEGMPMPRWVFFNGAELPGGIFGFGRPVEAMRPRARQVMGIPRGYRGLVPYSMFIAIPMFVPGGWMGHNLASLNPVFPEEGLSGLASITKAVALKVYRAGKFFGVTQWRSRALHIHVKFGPLGLLTAFTPAHSEPRSLTYFMEVTDERLRCACGDPTVTLRRPRPTRMIDADDDAAMRRLHEEIRRGARFQITDVPVHDGDRVRVPVGRLR